MLPESFLFAAPGALDATVVVAVLGLLIGSFLNVVIYRVPRTMQRDSDDYIASELTGQYQVHVKGAAPGARIPASDLALFDAKGGALPHSDRFNLMVPRSCCPHCGHQIKAIENIPVLSYLVLRGKCSQCKAPISARYPIIETVSAVLSGVLAWHFGTGWAGMAVLVFGWILLALTMIDYDTQLLPDDLCYPLLWLGLLVNLNGTFVPLRDAVIGAAAGYLVLWSIYWLFKLATGKEGMGYGDFKLLAALGAWLGWTMLPTIILLSSVVWAVVGIGLIVFTKRGRDKPIPFGPYLAAAGMIAMLYGAPLARLSSGFLAA